MTIARPTITFAGYEQIRLEVFDEEATSQTFRFVDRATRAGIDLTNATIILTVAPTLQGTATFTLGVGTGITIAADQTTNPGEFTAVASAANNTLNAGAELEYYWDLWINGTAIIPASPYVVKVPARNVTP